MGQERDLPPINALIVLDGEGMPGDPYAYAPDCSLANWVNEAEEVIRVRRLYFVVARTTKIATLEARMTRRIHITHLVDRTAAEVAVFGQEIVPDRYGDLVGDITGDGVVTVSYNEVYGAAAVPYAVTIRAWSHVHTAIVRINPGDFQYAETKVHYPRQGMGRLICKLIATTALEFNFAILRGNGTKVVGAANPAHNANGFYTYPTYGFDAPIVAANLANPLPANLNHYVQVLDLIQTQPGRDFWRDNGHALPVMSFDLAPASLSWQTLKILAL